MTPPKSILNPAFSYTPSYATDIRRSFAKARRQIKTARPENVTQLSSLLPKARKA